MTFHERSQTLPNGFHDAELSHFEKDYLSRRLTFDLMVWTGDMENKGIRELSRPARVPLERVAFLSIEPLDTKYDWLTSGAVIVDTGEGHLQQETYSLPKPPPNTSETWFYIKTTNSFLHMAAGDALLEWTGPEENRG